jgi:hypothetical protein
MIWIAPILAQDTAMVYRWRNGNLLRAGIVQQISYQRTMLLPQQSQFFKLFYMMRFFEFAYMYYWEDKFPLPDRKGMDMYSLQLLSSRRAQKDLLEHAAPVKYQKAFNRCVDTMEAVLRTEHSVLGSTYPGKKYVISACTAFGPAASAAEAMYRQRIVWQFAVLALIQRSKTLSPSGKTTMELNFMSVADKF